VENHAKKLAATPVIAIQKQNQVAGAQNNKFKSN